MTMDRYTGQSWWRSEEGLAHRDFLRSLTTVRIDVDMEPRAKSSRANNKLKTFLLGAEREWHRPTGWPRPNADVALDAWATTDKRTMPNAQNFCKWLLDELGGKSGDPVVFQDDRQIKMIFARVHRWSSDGQPKIRVDVQRVSLVNEGLRRAVDVARDADDPDKFRAAMAAPDWVYAGGDAQEWIELFKGDESDFGRDQLRRARYAAHFQTQQTALTAGDELAAEVVLTYADERRRAQLELTHTAEMLSMLNRLPYTVHIGHLLQGAARSSRRHRPHLLHGG